MSAGGPWPVTLASGRNRSVATAASGGSSSTTQPPTRRPANGTRTIVPTATAVAERVGHQVVELLVEAGDVGDDPRHHGRPGCVLGLVQAPTAALKLSRLPSCSHVNPGSSRPKWP